ncbi:glutathione S-transferase [Vibrio fluvialis]|uniref:glutathione S-transferase n=1 Tax=Vibrio fluvialis TaxID=676 RepID=UPI00192C3AAF|nr:glutathione S-transferase [Vibrio fluvialis]EKO3437020.1 glutathione S-transferase [Vibrio fluvialis]EKO3501062.1 glutathione S-transferase [Vibrio fluvialis]EKO3509255.1 glutathione S-transferase [Vibrio fluvialis]EKO3971350.1 glutathione S-transferase [Vibrio fluvialis]EKZ9002869.1 glutathione S-transferase [Vibrio fluvialis]
MEMLVGNGSTWSLRAWMCGRLANVELGIKVVDLTNSDYKKHLAVQSPSGLVPALNIDGTVIHDSLAIAEYFNELADGGLYPRDALQRAVARSLCAEMHSGFLSLRRLCPFSLEPVEPLTELTPELEADIARATTVFNQAQLPFMFEQAGAVDAFYAVLAFRLQSYGVALEGKAGEYQQSLLEWPLTKDAVVEALRWEDSKK